VDAAAGALLACLDPWSEEHGKKFIVITSKAKKSHFSNPIS